MSEDEESVPAKKALPKRQGRGNRMGALLNDLPDDEFWNNEMFDDSEEDAEYESESEEEDVVDADFDEPEPDISKEVIVEPKSDHRAKPKKSAYVDPKKKGADPASRAAQPPKRKRQPKEDTGPPAKVRKSRRSSAVAASVASIKRQQLDAKKKATRKRAPRAKKQYKNLTQEELLAEAVETERQNGISLDQLIHQEEKNKPKIFAKRVVEPPLLRILSRKELQSVTYVGLDPPTAQHAPPEVGRHVCAITGLPAKYLDPATNQWYATAAAFRVLRSGPLAAVTSPMKTEFSPMTTEAVS